MIIWPKQLATIQRLAAKEGLNTIEIVALPLKLRVTISTWDGPWTTYDINHDGEETWISG